MVDWVLLDFFDFLREVGILVLYGEFVNFGNVNNKFKILKNYKLNRIIYI